MNKKQEDNEKFINAATQRFVERMNCISAHYIEEKAKEQLADRQAETGIYPTD